MAEDVTPTGGSGRGSGDTSGGVASTSGGTAGSSDSGGANRSRDGHGSSGNGRPATAASVPPRGREPVPTIPGQPASSGRVAVSQGGVRPSTSGDNRRGSGGNGDGRQREAGGRAEEEKPSLTLVRGLEEKPEDAEEEPERPLFVGIPRATKAEKAQNAPVKPKGKASDVDSETVALLVSAAFEVPAFVFQRLTPLQGGHPWWSKTPDQVHDKVAVPLTEIINGMSPKVKKLIKENTNYAALLAGLVAVLDEPIQMEMEVHRQYKEAKLAYLRGLPQTVPSNGTGAKRTAQRPPSGLEGARSYWAEEGEEGVVGDTPI